MDKCVGVWKTLCEVWKTLCVGEGVKINSKIISKKFGGVECLFYFCGVQNSLDLSTVCNFLLVKAVVGLRIGEA